jgi:hypothetical protein
MLLAVVLGLCAVSIVDAVNADPARAASDAEHLVNDAAGQVVDDAGQVVYASDYVDARAPADEFCPRWTADL